MKKIVFIGGIGTTSQFGGEPTKNKEILKRLKNLGYSVFPIDTHKSRVSIMRLFLILLKLAYQILFHPSATFIFSTAFGNIYNIMKILHFYPIRLKIVYWVIGGLFADRVQTGYFKKKYLKPISHFIVEGYKMKATLAGLGFTNVFVKPNFKDIRPVKQSEKYDDGKIHFYFLSRIDPQKGVTYILNCAKQLNRNGYSKRYVIDFYGNINPAYRIEFEFVIQELDNVSYCGTLQLHKDENYKQIAKYHYMLFPTYWGGEGFPGVVIDAYIAGTPIIISDWNLNPEFVWEGKTGILVPTHDEQQLYKIMHEAISGKYDCKTMAKNCIETASRFDTNKVITKDFINQITN